MNSRLLFAFLCFTSLTTGCIVVDRDDDDDCCTEPVPQPPPALPGNVSFLWTFTGMRCDQAREVYGVNVEIPGHTLHNGGRFACNTGGVDGITLHDFNPGSYAYVLTAVDYRNQVIYEARGVFVINGNVTVQKDLTPLGNPASYAHLNWTFPGNQSCAQAGISKMEITLDDRAPASFDCIQGQQTPGLQTPYLEPGEHFIEFVAKDSFGRVLYYYNGGLTTRAYEPVYATYNLYAVGGASISWKFSDGSVLADCAQLDPSGNLMVGVNFQDTQTGQWVYGTVGDWHKCGDKPIVYSYLKPGTYKVSLYAKNGNIEYRSNQNISPILVQAHQFPGPNDALEVTMYRQNP